MPIHARLRASAKQVRDEGCNSLDHEEAMELIRFAAGFILDPARGSAVTHTKVAKHQLYQLGCAAANSTNGCRIVEIRAEAEKIERKLEDSCRLLNGDFRELVAKPPKT